MSSSKRLRATALVSTLIGGAIVACSAGSETSPTVVGPAGTPPAADTPVATSTPTDFVDHARILTTQSARTFDAARAAEKQATLAVMQARVGLHPEVTPQTNWTITTNAAVKGSVGIFGASFTTSSAADQMFFGTSTSATGTLTGGYNLGLVDGGTSGGNFFAFNNLHASKPTLQWSATITGGTSASVALSGDGTSVYILSDGGTLYCLQAANGNACSVWTNPTFTLNSTAITPWVDSSSNAIYVHNGSGSITRVNATTGNKQWTYSFSTSKSQGWPLEANNILYIGDGSGKFYRIQDPTTGTTDTQNGSAPTVAASVTVSGANGNCNTAASIDGSASLDSSANLVFLPYEGCAVSFPHYCSSGAGCTVNSGTWNYVHAGWTGSVPNNTFQTWPTLDGTYVYWVIADKPSSSTPISALWKAPYSLATVSGSNLVNASSSTGASVGSAPVVFGGLAYVGDETGYVEEFGCASAKSATTAFLAETSQSGTKVGTPIEFDDATGNIEYGFTSSSGGGVAQFPLWETGTASGFTWGCPTNMVACDNQQCGTGNNKTQCVPSAQCNASATCTTVAAAGMTVQYGVAAAEGNALVGGLDGGANICPSGTVIQAVLGADYGLPPSSDATQGGTTFAYSGTCDATDSLANTENACASSLNSSASCSLTANNATFGDPCVGTGKHFYAWFACGAKTDAGAPILCSRQNVVPSSGSDPCVSGVCTGTCSTGWADCNSNRQYDGCETNTSTDVNNCGGCGTACTIPTNGTATCTSGSCNSACNSGYSLCSASCVNKQTDNNNCGSCGNVCTGGKACYSGSCQNSATFTASGTFTVPVGVTSISAVAVGGGGDGGSGGRYSGGGGGGALCYANSIAVNPGDTISVMVGAGGSSTGTTGAAGASSGITYGSITVTAGGGGAGTGSNTNTSTTASGGAGGTGSVSGVSSSLYSCQSGGAGGGVNFVQGNARVFGGGGGAAGYSAAGGAGGYASGNSCTSASNGAASTGAGGGGGGGGSGTTTKSPDSEGGSGGGVGLTGAGVSGSGGAYYCPTGTSATDGSGVGGGAGSNGVAGQPASPGGAGAATGDGGAYGGGGAGGYNNSSAGGAGAVRIIWGSGRSYPTNAN